MSSIVTPKYISGRKAGADLSATAKRYTALQLEADGDVNTTGADEADFIGFLQNLPADTKGAEIAGPSGGSKAIAAGTITAGNFLKTDASGHLLAIGPNETARCVAMALESAVDNDVFEVLVLQPTLQSGSSVVGVSSIAITATLAEIVAGTEKLPGVAGKSIKIHAMNFMANGSFAAGTAIVLEDSTTGTDYVSLAQAQLSDNSPLSLGSTGVTLGAAFVDGGAVGEGLTVSQTGSDFTTATDLGINLLYSYV